MAKKKTALIDKDLHVKDLHLVFTEFFEPDNEFAFAGGSKNQFRMRMIALLGGMSILGFTVLARLPTIPEAIGAVVAAYVATEAVLFASEKFQEVTAERPFYGILMFTGIMLSLLVGIGLFV